VIWKPQEWGVHGPCWAAAPQEKKNVDLIVGDHQSEFYSYRSNTDLTFCHNQVLQKRLDAIMLHFTYLYRSGMSMFRLGKRFCKILSLRYYSWIILSNL